MKNTKELVRLLSDGKVSRREFMERAAALGVTATVASSLATKAAQAAPKKGGTLRVGKAHGQTTDSLDPVSWENGFMLQMGYAVQDYLTEIDNTGQLDPDGAAGHPPDRHGAQHPPLGEPPQPIQSVH